MERPVKGKKLNNLQRTKTLKQQGCVRDTVRREALKRREQLGTALDARERT